MTSTAAEDLCIVCNVSGARFCDRCRSTRYCSEACQRADWPTHKLLCPAFLKFNTTKRPSKDHFRAILFPVDKERPELIWLHCPWHDNKEGGKYQYPIKDIYLGKDAFPRSTSIQYNRILERGLSDTIYVCYRDTFLVDGSKLNKGVAAITTTQPYQCHGWRGPLLAYGKKGLGIDPIACRDLDMNDFRHISDFFLSYGRALQPATQKPIGEKIKGVRINCVGDQRVFNKPKFEAVEILPTDPIFSDHDSSDITKRIGLAVFTRPCPPDPKWANDEGNKVFQGGLDGGNPFNNQDATFLHLSCDPKAGFDLRRGSMGWAWAPMRWQNGVGSAIVVRQDKKPLLPVHAEALCKYCRYEARAFLAHSLGEYAPEKPIEKEAALAMICRPAFVISWYKLLDEKRAKGEATDSTYPYYDV
ncbi:hypothetical protein GGS26DRAFT_551210 [Hypomontagnella submonticulosa]|nr:hypothetical protein GGS26DRAFT_551210 [Hypomontagnella submonticulosa]